MKNKEVINNTKTLEEEKEEILITIDMLKGKKKYMIVIQNITIILIIITVMTVMIKRSI